MRIRRLVIIVVPCMAVVLGVVVLPQGASAATNDVVVVGHGWGHGRGMGQYGAYGYAVDHGW